MSNTEAPEYLVLELPLLTLAVLGFLDRLQRRFPGCETETHAHPLGGVRIRITLPSREALVFALASAGLLRVKVFASSE